MRSSGAVGSFRARGCLNTGVARGQTFTRDDAGSRMRPLSRSRSPFRRRRCGRGGAGLRGLPEGGRHGQVVSLGAEGPLHAIPPGASTSADTSKRDIRSSNQ